MGVTITICKSLLLLCAILSGFSCSRVTEDDVYRIALPKGLREVSGLTRFGDDLLAVADEKSWIYRVSLTEGVAERLGSIGKPAIKGDFEGIGLSGNTVYVVTSEGWLYHWAVSSAADDFGLVDTGLGKRCEIEGLEIKQGLAYIACKSPYEKALEEQVTIFVWNIAEGQLDKAIEVAWSDLELRGKLHPSAITFVDDGLLLLAARQKRWVVITEAGTYVRGGKLPNRESHPQAEGVAVFEGMTYIADEGKKQGTVTRYAGSF